MPRAVIALCIVFGVLSAAAPLAGAEPGEAPIALLSPAGGARVAADLDGIPVSFTCPPTTATPPFGSGAYGVDLATSAALGPNGRLAQPTIGSGLARPRDGDASTCDARLGGGGAPRPQATPGLYYWQAWRYCDACSGGYETSEVRTFTVTIGGNIRLQAPTRAFVGYPVAFVVDAATTGVSSATRVERRRGAGWVTVATERDGAIIGTLPRGRQTLRAVATSAGGSVTSPVRTVVVVRAVRWQTSTRDDGDYRDAQRPSVRLRVTGGGRRITGLHADVPVDCADATAPGGVRPNIRTVTLPTVRVAPDGRFAVAARFRGARVTFTGRLAKRRLLATRARYADSACVGSIAVDARHG